MLLDFKFKNFKSFKDEADFFMTAAPKQQGLNYSVTEIVPKVKGRKKQLKHCVHLSYMEQMLQEKPM